MQQDLNADRATLPTIDGFPASDARRLEYTVLLSDGTPRDISNDTPEWYLLGKPYDNDADALVSDSDPDVEIVTDSRVDTTAGVFEVRIDPDALAGEWGPRYQRIRIDAPGDTRLTWEGEIILTADGETA
jgi:hypothetical protein